MNRRLKVGDRVRNLRTKAYKDEPIIIIDNIGGSGSGGRYHIKYLNVYNVGSTNMVSWVGVSDITLDIEYYRNLKIEKILNE